MWYYNIHIFRTSPFDIESTQNERFGIESTQIKIARQKGGNIIVRRARDRVLQLQVITGFGSTVNISRSSTIVNNCSTISRNVVRRIHLTLANSYHQTQIHGCRFLPRDLLALNRVSSIFPKLDTFVAPGVYRARNTEYRANCRSVAEEDYTLARRRVANCPETCYRRWHLHLCNATSAVTWLCGGFIGVPARFSADDKIV